MTRAILAILVVLGLGVVGTALSTVAQAEYLSQFQAPANQGNNS